MDIKSISFLVFISFFATILAATPYMPCPSPLGKVSHVSVSGCSSSPCLLKKGSDISINVEFTATDDIVNATEEVNGIIDNVAVPFPTQHPDACTTHGLKCPLKAGQKYTYTAVTPVSKLYPSLRLIVEWAIKDVSGENVFCVKIPVEIR